MIFLSLLITVIKLYVKQKKKKNHIKRSAQSIPNIFNVDCF